jgi:pyruvate dehydrogenase E2 component (dihydrolipoamide acetyltransferase)
VPVRRPIALIAEPGVAPSAAGPSGAPVAAVEPAGRPAAAPTAAASAQPAAAAGPPGGRQTVSPRARRIARELGVALAELVGSGPAGRIVERDVRAAAQAAPAAVPAPAGRILASPLARKLAAEHGLDLAGLRGSGPGGRIVVKDVLAAVASGPAPAAPAPAAAPMAPSPAPPAPSAAAAPTGETVALGRLRRITAERMAASAQAVARVTLFMTVDMAEAVRFRAQLGPEFERRYGARLSYDAMIAKACGLALREHPELNAQWADGAIRPLAEVNVGVAVALDEGLLVVVLRQADARPLHQLQTDLNGLVERARAGRLSPDDISGSSFTLTNLGGYGVEGFTPIVNLPEAAILGVGTIARQPAVVADQLAIREQMTLSLAFDHRVADGAPAARLLQRVKQILEAPYILLT